MRWEIEVSDRLGSWGTAGRVFKPGIWVTDDPRIAAAGRNQVNVMVREIADDDPGGQVVYDTSAEPTPGPMTTDDLKAAAGSTGIPCGFEAGLPTACNGTFKSARTRDQHRDKVHGGWRPTEVMEPEPEPEPEEGEIESPFEETETE